MRERSKISRLAERDPAIYSKLPNERTPIIKNTWIAPQKHRRYRFLQGCRAIAIRSRDLTGSAIRIKPSTSGGREREREREKERGDWIEKRRFADNKRDSDRSGPVLATRTKEFNLLEWKMRAFVFRGSRSRSRKSETSPRYVITSGHRSSRTPLFFDRTEERKQERKRKSERKKWI